MAHGARVSEAAQQCPTCQADINGAPPHGQPSLILRAGLPSNSNGNLSQAMQLHLTKLARRTSVPALTNCIVGVSGVRRDGMVCVFGVFLSIPGLHGCSRLIYPFYVVFPRHRNRHWLDMRLLCLALAMTLALLEGGQEEQRRTSAFSDRTALSPRLSAMVYDHSAAVLLVVLFVFLCRFWGRQ